MSHDTLTIIAVLVLVAAVLAVTHWQTVLRAVFVVAIALAVYGAIAVIYGLVLVLTAHHG